VLASRSRRQHSRRRQARVVVVGSANTDLTIRASHLPTTGETVLGGELYTAFGGKGANQAIAAKRAGARVALLAKLGDDRYGRDYARYLRHEGIETSGLLWESALPSGVALITVDRRGQNQIAVAPGANAALIPDDLHGLDAYLTSVQVLLTQLETPLETVETAIRRAKAAGIITLLNPAPARRLPIRLARFVDFLIPNESEAAVLCGQPVGTLQQVRTAARLLHRQGYRTVIITLGKRGVVYTDEHRVIHLPGHMVQAKDATAAGDTFVGYLAYALAEGHILPDALKLANAAAALAVTRKGAQPSIPHRDELRHFPAIV
jgi:ribokinase